MKPISLEIVDGIINELHAQGQLGFYRIPDDYDGFINLLKKDQFYTLNMGLVGMASLAKIPTEDEIKGVNEQEPF